MNSSRARHVLESLNPGLGFEVGDVNRLPLFPITNADEIFAAIESAFTTHESHREPSVEFRTPGPSPWRHAQAWAQLAVDRPENTPLPPYTPELDPEPPTDHLSYALGIALGRFHPDGSGILDPSTASGSASLAHALPAGILFLDGTLDLDSPHDSLADPAAAPLHAAWTTHGRAISPKRTLRDYLRLDFFSDVHRPMYENRPIHWPLSSEKKTFVAWINIHRFTASTLRTLLADQLHPTLTRLDGQLTDLRTLRDGADPKAARKAEKLFATIQKSRDELDRFITDVTQCAEKGPLPPDAKTPPRDADAPYDPDLDDGVMINSAALYPLLQPQWKDPAKWWKELATASGRKDYDWSHLAARYFPTRVDDKCRTDPSLAVAHRCFWRYHPERAYAWELRLQDEISPDFTIDEPGSDEARATFLAKHPDTAAEVRAKEAKRRERKASKVGEDDQDDQADLFDDGGASEDVPPSQKATIATLRAQIEKIQTPQRVTSTLRLHELHAAAGPFNQDRLEREGRLVKVRGSRKFQPKGRSYHFVIPVSGDSMDPTIPDGSHCVFQRANSAPDGRIVLVYRQRPEDPDRGGRLAVKIFREGQGGKPAMFESINPRHESFPAGPNDRIEAIWIGNVELLDS